MTDPRSSYISQDSRKFLQQLLVQSQFSLGCALSCSLNFLHEGASQRWLCLLLAAALSWFLARQAAALLRHVTALYKLHSSQNYCGICISLLTSGWYLLPMLCRTMTITFSVAVLAGVSIINQQFLSATEALRFWTPLTICYTLLVVYMQGEEHVKPLNVAKSSSYFTKTLLFWSCRGAASSAQQPGCHQCSCGASRGLDGPDADCGTLG